MLINVLIADDDALIREGLKIILQSDGRFTVVDCVENGLQALQCCESKKVDVVLLDVRMPVMDGLQAAKEISAKTTVQSLILTTFDDDDFILTAMKNGSRGYLLKNSPPARIMDAIKIIYDGGLFLQDIAMDKIREELLFQAREKIPADLFSDREMDIIKLIAKGLSNREIAKELFMSEGTVKNHITSVLNKTNLEHRTQIAIYYLTGQKA